MAWNRVSPPVAAAFFLGLAVLCPSAVRAADTVLVVSIDPTSANLWPLYIGQKNGYFDAADLKIELAFAQSNAAATQQVAAASYNITPSAGLVDPIRAVEKGAPVAIVRILVQAPPYALLAKPNIKTMAELKGKTIIIGGDKDITRIFLEAMLKANGVEPGEFDLVFAGATGARFSALQAGAVDAALLTTPFNFYAESAGFTNLGFTFDYLPEMPFAGVVVNRNWAATNPKVVERYLAVYLKSIAWFTDTRNRDQAVKILMEPSKLKQADIEKTYDFLRDKNLFETTGKVSKAKLGKIVDALRDLGDIPRDFPVDRLLLPGMTQVAD